MERVWRILREVNVRLSYAIHRRPVAWTILLFGPVFVVGFLLSGSVWEATGPVVGVSIGFVVTMRSERERRRFAQWSKTHPMPGSQVGA